MDSPKYFSSRPQDKKNDDPINEDNQSGGYVRWFIIRGTDQKKSIGKLSPFLIDKALKAAAGDLKTVRRLQQADSMLEAPTST